MPCDPHSLCTHPQREDPCRDRGRSVLSCLPVSNAVLSRFVGLILKIPLLAGITFTYESFDSIEWDTVKILLRAPRVP
jgi:hypothetical protein